MKKELSVSNCIRKFVKEMKALVVERNITNGPKISFEVEENRSIEPSYNSTEDDFSFEKKGPTTYIIKITEDTYF